MAVLITEFEKGTERRLDLFKGSDGAIDGQEKLSGILNHGCYGRGVLLELQTRYRHQQSKEKIDSHVDLLSDQYAFCRGHAHIARELFERY